MLILSAICMLGFPAPARRFEVDQPVPDDRLLRLSGFSEHRWIVQLFDHYQMDAPP